MKISGAVHEGLSKYPVNDTSYCYDAVRKLHKREKTVFGIKFY